jgi:hypothetical protein
MCCAMNVVGTIEDLHKCLLNVLRMPTVRCPNTRLLLSIRTSKPEGAAALSTDAASQKQSPAHCLK